MNKAIFWDRDGVLNSVIDRPGLKNVSPQKFENFKLVTGIGKVLEDAKLAGYVNIIVTNQPDIARNILSWQELNRMHDFLKAQAPAVEAVCVCPHTSEQNCGCRKPKPGMLLDAAKDYKIELAKSYMVGDKQSDIDAGRNAGVKPILLKTSYNKEVRGYEFAITDLSEIKKLISQ